MARRKPAPDEGALTPPKSTPAASFHFDEGFLPYVPRLQEYADRHHLKLGPAVRELVKEALDRLADPSPASAPDPVAATGLQDVRESVRSLEVALAMGLKEQRDRFEVLRDELAQVLRLALLAFKDLEESQVEELVRKVFKR